MKHAILTIILIVVATMLVGADYYVNIYHAPNNQAAGTMKVKISGVTVDSGTLVWVSNIGDNTGGRYAAYDLQGPTVGANVTVYCECHRKDCPFITDSCSNVFTNQSDTPYNVGICDLGYDPWEPPTDPSGL